MANVQTDQGWYADENWVKQSAGTLGTVSGGGGGGGTFTQLPQWGSSTPPTAQQVRENGLRVRQWTVSGGAIRELFFLAAQGSEVYAATVNYVSYTLSYTQGATFYRADTTDSAALTRTCSTQDANYPTAWFNDNGASGQTQWVIEPVFTTRDAMLTAFSTPASHTISKANTGYALACWAKYKSYGGDTIYVRPVLISASQGAAHLQKDEQGGSGVEYVYTKDNAGHTLYMAMSIDAFDPENLSATGAWLADFTSATMPSVTPSDIADTLFPLILGASNFHWGEIDNPYAGGGTSEAGGGDGTFDFESTPIAFPGLPSIGGYDTGFTTMYNPTTSELKALANYMWAGAFDIENFKKLFADPMDAIIGLSLVPLTYSQIAGASSTLVVGNISTGLSMKKVSVQYVQVNCGTVQVPAKWGAYLDYAPYTKLQLYLPYIGFVDIAPDDVMNGSISVQYTIDLMSGTALASVMCKDHVLYCFGANCSCSCPVTSGQYKNGALGVLDGIGIAASTASQMIPSISNLKAGGVAANMIAAGANATAALAEGAHKEFDNVQAMMKPAISRSGSIGGPMGLMNIQIPYLVLTVPRMCIPGDQETYMGYPSFVTKQMTDLTGYTEIMVTHLNNMSCTSVEAEEIISLLENGVIF